MPLINILTRSGNREALFAKMSSSLQRQTYRNVRHIVSNDNPECTYLESQGQEVVPVRADRSRRGFYNQYLNDLAKAVTEGWVLIIDDDAVFIHDGFLEALAAVCRHRQPHEIVGFTGYVHPIRRARHPPWPLRRQVVGTRGSFFPMPTAGHVDMSSFCVHHTALKALQIPAQLGADFWMLTQWAKRGYSLWFADSLPTGIWANHEGPREGSNGSTPQSIVTGRGKAVRGLMKSITSHKTHARA